MADTPDVPGSAEKLLTAEPEHSQAEVEAEALLFPVCPYIGGANCPFRGRSGLCLWNLRPCPFRKEHCTPAGPWSL